MTETKTQGADVYGPHWLKCCDHCGCAPKRRDGHDDSCAHGCNDAEIAEARA